MAIAGDRKAFDALVKRFRGMAFTIARRRLRDLGLAQL
jgi:hypothetical protein